MTMSERAAAADARAIYGDTYEDDHAMLSHATHAGVV